MRKTSLLVVLALAGLALLAGSGTAAAGSADVGTALIDASIPSEDDDCLVQGCGCPDPRICSMAGVDLTVDADGFDSHATATAAGTGANYCPPEDYPCECSDPRICGATVQELAALTTDGTTADVTPADLTDGTVESEMGIGYCPPEDEPCECSDPRICSANRLDLVALDVDTECIQDWCSCPTPCFGVEATARRLAV